jgi:hypothetical protein
MMETIKEVREAFWNDHPEYKSHYRKTWRQNQYNTDIRCAFGDYVNELWTFNVISDTLADTVTL